MCLSAKLAQILYRAVTTSSHSEFSFMIRLFKTRKKTNAPTHRFPMFVLKLKRTMRIKDNHRPKCTFLNIYVTVTPLSDESVCFYAVFGQLFSQSETMNQVSTINTSPILNITPFHYITLPHTLVTMYILELV